MSDTQTIPVPALIEQIKTFSTSGFALGVHIQFQTPRIMFQAYDPDWIDEYSKSGLIAQDPSVLWGFLNNGCTRWADLNLPDDAGVMSKAAEYGLKYGITHAQTVDGSKSICGLARSDRELTDQEIIDVSALFEQLHAVTADIKTLDQSELDALKKIGVTLTPR